VTPGWSGRGKLTPILGVLPPQARPAHGRKQPVPAQRARVVGRASSGRYGAAGHLAMKIMTLDRLALPEIQLGGLHMPVNCDIILRWAATPSQLAAVGTALWHWCVRATGDAGIYRQLDSQALADLMEGKFPASCQTPRRCDLRGVHFRFQGEASQGRQATIAGLRRDLPAEGVEDVVVGGRSWNVDD
jgi:hypothetical protein